MQWAVPTNTMTRLEVQSAAIRSLDNVPRYALGGVVVGVMGVFFWQVTQVDKAYRHGYSSAPTQSYITAASVGAAAGALYGAIRPHAHWERITP